MCASLETALINDIPPGLEEALLPYKANPCVQLCCHRSMGVASEELIILELPIWPIDPARFRPR